MSKSIMSSLVFEVGVRWRCAHYDLLKSSFHRILNLKQLQTLCKLTPKYFHTLLQCTVCYSFAVQWLMAIKIDMHNKVEFIYSVVSLEATFQLLEDHNTLIWPSLYMWRSQYSNTTVAVHVGMLACFWCEFVELCLRMCACVCVCSLQNMW